MKLPGKGDPTWAEYRLVWHDHRARAIDNRVWWVAPYNVVGNRTVTTVPCRFKAADGNLPVVPFDDRIDQSKTQPVARDVAGAFSPVQLLPDEW